MFSKHQWVKNETTLSSGVPWKSANLVPRVLCHIRTKTKSPKLEIRLIMNSGYAATIK